MPTRSSPAARVRAAVSGRVAIVALASFAGLLPAACHSHSAPAPDGPTARPVAASPSDRERAIHLLSRTTYGVRPADVDQVLRMGRSAWLDRQMRPDSIADSATTRRLAALAAPAVNPLTGEFQRAAAAVAIRITAPTTPAANRDSAAMLVARATALLRTTLGTAQQELTSAVQKATNIDRQLAVGQAAALPTPQQISEIQRQISLAQEMLAAAQAHIATTQRQIAGARGTPAPVMLAGVAGRGAAPISSTPVYTTPAINLAPTNGMVIKPVAKFTTQSATIVLNSLANEKLTRAVYSERQLEEVMTDFWFNHFNVVYNKPPIHAVLADYEAMIRKHVFGRFEDMLVATAQHPAMMVYLDNHLSSAPPVIGLGATPPMPGGLNENYARELMELHTLGVNGGYTQKDVMEVARALTGWGIVPPVSGQVVRPAALLGPASVQSVGAFVYTPQRHDPGVKTVLGQTFSYPPPQGINEGLEILRMLARHPSTANFVATKLVRHFVNDQPPADLVAEVARVFRETDGDLRKVTRALFLSEKFYATQHVRAKVKRPFEFIASALRLTDADVTAASNGARVPLQTFRHIPYGEPAPTGYATTADVWMSAGALVARMNFALDLVNGRVGGVSLPPWANPPTGTDPAAAMNDMLQRLMAGAPTAQLQKAITDDLTASAFNSRIPPSARATALAIGSPEFQRY